MAVQSQALGSFTANTTPNANTYGAGAYTPLTIPTYEGSGVATHPSVVLVDRGWNGWRYWMAMTPYPSQNNSLENPSVIVSDDGITWQTPEGATNPIEPDPRGASYNSDTHLVIGNDGFMYLFWRTLYDPGPLKERIMMRRSSDGIAWSDRAILIENDFSLSRLMSPSFVPNADGSWSMFAVDIVPSPNIIVRQDADSLTGTWSDPVTVTGITVGAGRDPWHLDVHRIGGEYVALCDDAPLNVTGSEGNLYRAVSQDGLTFTTDPDIFAATEENYRSCLVPAVVNGRAGYQVFYSTIGTISTGHVSIDSDLPDSPANMLAAGEPVAPFVFGDRVDRADSGSSPGTSTSGTAWTAMSGTWGVDSNALYVTTDTNGKCVTDLGEADCRFGFTVKTPPLSGSQVWIMARVSDTSNYWRFGANGQVWTLQSVEAGGININVNAGYGRDAVAGDRMAVECDGNIIRCFVNGFEVLSTTSATFNTATEFGIQTQRAETRVENVYATL